MQTHCIYTRLGVVRYGIPYRECHTVYRTESYGMTKTIPIPYRKFWYTGNSVWQFSIPLPYRVIGIPYRISVYRTFAVYRTAIWHSDIPLYRVLWYGIPLYHYTVKKSIISKILKKKSSFQLLQKIGFPILILLFFSIIKILIF